MAEKGNMKRLLIYLTYDKQNIIDGYIGYFLRSMRPLISSIAVVCNMPHIAKGLHNLTGYADHIFYRRNKGLDAGGFKDALCTFIGWDALAQYDELILVNDSFYGPFDDISRIFSEMESRGLDFWGLMKRGAGAYGSTGTDPEHILSFFYVFQSPLLHSEAFRSYWEEMPYYEGYMDVVKKYERQLTRHFACLGYRYDAYADTAPNETQNLRNQFFQCDYLSYEMITKRNFPFLKRKQLANNTLFCQTQENLALSLAYIEGHTDYDADLIWKNLIRTQAPAELYRSLGLHYILSEGRAGRHADALVCAKVKWLNAVDTVCEYLGRIRDGCEVRLFTDDADVEKAYHEKGFSAERSDRSDIELLCAVDRKKYRYICLIHDTDLSSDVQPSCTGKSYFFNIWENLLKDAGYIGSVIGLLEQKTYLGMLLHPVPIFSAWLGRLGLKWEGRFETVRKDLKDLGLRTTADPKIPPIHVTDNFWVRADVLDCFGKKTERIGTIPEEDYPYLWNYIVQEAGKLTGIVESAFYASMNETNYHFYLKTFLEWLTDRYGAHRELHEFQEIFRVEAAVEECRARYENWYVYGTGEIAHRCFEWLRDASGFLVSDGQTKSRTFHGKPVYCLSEMDGKEEAGVILCLSRENQEQVIGMLEKKWNGDYYTIH